MVPERPMRYARIGRSGTILKFLIALYMLILLYYYYYMHIIAHIKPYSSKKARDITLDDEKCDVHYRARRWPIIEC